MRDEDSGSESPRLQSARPATEAIAPIVAEAATRVIDILRTQGRGRVEDAARWTRRRLELHQKSRDIEALYNKLGRELVCLVEAGEVTHPGLARRAARVRDEERSYEEAQRAGSEGLGEE